MLGKLLKYEYKATSIMFLPLLLAFLATTAIIRLFGFLGSDFFAFRLLYGMLAFVTVILCIIVVFYPVISGAQRFSKNLLKDEGYLMNTLPVTSTKLILSKALVSITWVFASAISCGLAFLIMIAGDEDAEKIIDGIKELYKIFLKEFVNRPLFIVLSIVLIIASFIAFLFMFYAALSIGHLANKRRGAMAVLSFIGLYFATQMIGSTVFMVIEDTAEGFDMTKQTDLVFGISAGLQILYIAIYFIITKTILKKNLNLE